MEMSFIHNFSVNKNYYIYDVNTNKIIEVDEIIYSISPHFNSLSLQEIQKKFADRFSSESIDKAWKTLQMNHQEKGHLSDARPRNRGDTFDWDSIEVQINSKVRQMVLNVTDNCNLKCKYCIYSGDFTGRRSHRKTFMTRKVAKKALDYFLEHSKKQKGFIALGFYGGEPLLNFDLVKWCIEYVSKNYNRDTPLILTITTNGTVFNQEIIDFLIRHKAILFISLDGPQNIHDKNRKSLEGKGTFHKIVDNLERIRNISYTYYKSNVRFSAVLTGGTDYRQLDNFFAVYGLPVRVSSLETFQAENLQHLNPFVNPLRNFQEMREKFIKAATNNVFNNEKSPREYIFVKNLFENTLRRIHRRFPCQDLLQDPPGHSICMPGANRIFVSTDGVFYTCEKVEGNKNMEIGDVDSGVNVRTVKTMIQDYYNFINEECSDCWLIRMCSACFVHAVHNNRFDTDRFRQNCQFRKKVFHDALKMYFEIAAQNPNSFDWLERDELDDLLDY